MIPRARVHEIVAAYDKKNLCVAVLGSHSALDVCDGAREERLPTYVICQKGREKTYTKYFKRYQGFGVVDDVLVLARFADLLRPENQQKLRAKNALFVPNRSFTSYIDLTRIEDEFFVPLVGSRNLLRSEERGGVRDYYWLLEKAKLPHPPKIADPRELEDLCLVKLKHAKKKLERGFFTAASYEEYRKKAEALLGGGVISSEDLASARIEKYIIGPVFNLDFFYSPLHQRLELLGVDWRFESSLDGYVRLPASQQLTLAELPEYTVCGHNTATLRESLLEKAFQLGERYVAAAREHYPPGILGPFCLQTCVDKDLQFYIYDIAPRIGGGTNVHMYWGHPYGNILFRRRMSTGRRLAMEIAEAARADKLELLVT